MRFLEGRKRGGSWSAVGVFVSIFWIWIGRVEERWKLCVIWRCGGGDVRVHDGGWRAGIWGRALEWGARARLWELGL